MLTADVFRKISIKLSPYVFASLPLQWPIEKWHKSLRAISTETKAKEFIFHKS